ncbi:cyclic nucleotide-binding domain-containing protein [Saccharothrix mutabilis subsp. mutabilis]|uniref:Cyclic nucleotide-binding domain-containing protein n=1 Tax=Saccharothrix mutabilis subsp. mutabilis TaxID=66855 RepID=A0ABN0UHV6_9PSEU
MTTDLADLALFRPLAPAHRALIAASAHPEHHPAGTRLFDQDQPAEHSWVVLTGCVALDAAVPGRGAVTVQGVGPGELLGLSWLVPPHRWHFGATVVVPAHLARLDVARLRETAERDPEFGYRLSLVLAEAMLHRLQSTRYRLLDLYRNPS